jgi:hypothetical protein
VTFQHLVASTSYLVPGESHALTFTDPPVSLRAREGGPTGLLFDAEHRFEIVETETKLWRVTTRMYQYRLLDHDERELLVYHWQPGEDFQGPNHPHVHVSAALRAKTSATSDRSIDLDNKHLATGRVSLEAVIRMLIDEFDIEPQRDDWREILDRTEAVFREEATQQT